MIKTFKSLYQVEQIIDIDKLFEMLIHTKPVKEIEEQLNYTGVADNSLIESDANYDIWDVIQAYEDDIYSDVMEDDSYRDMIYESVVENFLDNISYEAHHINAFSYAEDFIEIFKNYTYDITSVRQFGNLIEDIYNNVYKDAIEYFDFKFEKYKYNVIHEALTTLKQNSYNFTEATFSDLIADIALAIDNALTGYIDYDKPMKPDDIVPLLNEFYITYVMIKGGFDLDAHEAVDIINDFAIGLYDAAQTFIDYFDFSETEEFKEELEDEDNIVSYLSNNVYDLWDYLSEYVSSYEENLDPDLPVLVSEYYYIEDIDEELIYDVIVYEDRDNDIVVFDLFRTFAPACRLRIEYDKISGVISIHGKNTHATGNDNDDVYYLKHMIDIYPNGHFSELNMFCTGSFGTTTLNTQDLVELIMYSFVGDNDYDPYVLYSTYFHHSAISLINDILYNERYIVYYNYRYNNDNEIEIADRISDAFKTFYEKIKEYRKERGVVNDKANTTKKVL
jgi:hypothetical protein